MDSSRRRILLGAAALPLLAACGTPLPITTRPADDPAAAGILRQSAEAHGLAAYARITDLSVAYDGRWRPLVGRIQPEVVDEGFRGRSEERLLPHRGIVAQAYTGPAGSKQVAWQRGDGAGRAGDIAVWRNGVVADDRPTREAAALVAEGYGLFLLGPLWLSDRRVIARNAGTDHVDGRLCDVIDTWLMPGLGRSEMDRVTLSIDRSDRIARRCRFTLEGADGTRGAVAEVDTFDHVSLAGLTIATRYYERVVHPIRLPAHDWRLTAFDANRSFTSSDVTGPAFVGAAARPATVLRG